MIKYCINAKYAILYPRPATLTVKINHRDNFPQNEPYTTIALLRYIFFKCCWIALSPPIMESGCFFTALNNSNSSSNLFRFLIFGRIHSSSYAAGRPFLLLSCIGRETSRLATEIVAVEVLVDFLFALASLHSPFFFQRIRVFYSLFLCWLHLSNIFESSPTCLLYFFLFFILFIKSRSIPSQTTFLPLQFFFFANRCVDL